MSTPEDDEMWTPPLTGFTPVTAADVTDEKLVAGQLRALQRDINTRLDSIDETLKLFGRIDAKLDVIIDRQNETDRRVGALEVQQSRTEQRLAALELPKVTRRKPARRKR